MGTSSGITHIDKDQNSLGQVTSEVGFKTDN